jgi:hypothetical protein
LEGNTPPAESCPGSSWHDHQVVPIGGLEQTRDFVYSLCEDNRRGHLLQHGRAIKGIGHQVLTRCEDCVGGKNSCEDLSNFSLRWHREVIAIPSRLLTKEYFFTRLRAGGAGSIERVRPRERPGFRAYFSNLKAWDHSFRVKPGIHQSMQSGSMARAASALPISAVSQPS